MRELSAFEIETAVNGGDGNWTSCSVVGNNGTAPQGYNNAAWICQDYTAQGQAIGSPYSVNDSNNPFSEGAPHYQAPNY